MKKSPYDYMSPNPLLLVVRYKSKCLIITPAWPPRFFVLNPLDFYLWECLVFSLWWNFNRHWRWNDINAFMMLVTLVAIVSRSLKECSNLWPDVFKRVLNQIENTSNICCKEKLKFSSQEVFNISLYHRHRCYYVPF